MAETKVAETTAKETKVAETTAVAEAVTSKGKTKKVMAVKNHKCKIGGIAYILEKSKDYNLPEDVATILANAQVVIVK